MWEERPNGQCVLCDVPEAFLHDNAAAKPMVCATPATYAGSADSFPAQSRQREANESDSSTAERSARDATRWLHGRDRQTRTQPGGEVSDQFGFISEVGHFSGRRNGASEECSVRKMAVLTVIADVLAGRSLAAYYGVLGDRRSLAPYCGVLPVRSIAGYYWSPGRAKPRDHWCFAFPGAHDVF